MKTVLSVLFVATLTLWAGCASTTPEQREANNQRQATEQRRRSDDDLRRKFARYSSAELKLMDARYRDLQTSSGRDLNVRVNSLVPANSDSKNIERVLQIERELLRRWKAGDSEAYLPDFASLSPPSKE